MIDELQEKLQLEIARLEERRRMYRFYSTKAIDPEERQSYLISIEDLDREIDRKMREYYGN